MLQATFETPEPQLILRTPSEDVGCFCLLPTPGPGASHAWAAGLSSASCGLGRRRGTWRRSASSRSTAAATSASSLRAASSASVRLRWERAAGRWKLWVGAGERRVLQATFETPEPQLELHMDRNCFDLALLPLPGPGTLQSPPPAHAQLQARIDQLTAELETEKLQKAEIQQEKQKLQKQLDESKRRHELLTQEKEEETQKVESAQHEIKALQQRIDLLTEQLETEKQQAEIVQNLQKQLDELAQQKAEEMKTVEDLQKENETLQQRFALLTQKAQKSEMTQCILQLKEQCDAFLAPQLESVL